MNKQRLPMECGGCAPSNDSSDGNNKGEPMLQTMASDLASLKETIRKFQENGGANQDSCGCSGSSGSNSLADEMRK